MEPDGWQPAATRASRGDIASFPQHQKIARHTEHALDEQHAQDGEEVGSRCRVLVADDRSKRVVELHRGQGK